MNALLTADKKENIMATGENVEPMLGSPYDLKTSSPKLTTPYKALDKNFFSKQRKIATDELKNNRNFRTLMEVAEGYFIKGVLPQAQSYYKQALQINPQLFLAYQRLKSIALRKKDLRSLEENQRLLVKSSSRRPDFLHEYIVMRIGLHPKDRSVIEESLRDVEEILEKEPKNASYLNSRGFILLSFFQDIEKAVPSFKSALAIQPENIDANNNLGVALMRKGKFRDAIKHFEVCITVSPKYQFAYRNLCLCYRSMGMFQEAVNVLQKAAEAGVVLPRDWQHLHGWLLLQAGNLLGAQKWYKNLILQEPNNNLLYNNLGVCFLELGDIEKAILGFEKAIRIVKNKLKQNKSPDPRDLHAFYNRGRAALDRGDRQKAKEIRKDLTKINPKDAYALYVEANNHLAEGRLQEAIDVYQESIEADPLLPDPYPDVAFILECHAQDYQATIRLLEAAVERGIRTALVLNNLAYAYIKAGDLDKADQVIRKQTENSRPEFLATKGLLSLHRMDLAEGDSLYSQAIERLKDHEKPMATQLWHYERALYFHKSNDRKEALREAELAKSIRSSYLNKNIQALIDELTR